MADSVDRVFGHALNTVNKIRPGSQKPPSSDRLALYGLYKQSMEGDVADISSRPASTADGNNSENVRKEQEKWDAWKANEGLSRTEAKRRYIEKLIETMHKYASTTTEAKELVEELEFVWDQIKNNSQHSSSERSSPLQHIERSGYLNNSSSGVGIPSSAAAMEGVGKKQGELTVLSPMSQSDEEALMEEEREEFVDAPVSQVDGAELQDVSEAGADVEHEDVGVQASAGPVASSGDKRWRRKIESSLSKLTNEIAALREQLESTRYFKQQRSRSWFGWVLRLTWWAVQLIVADAFLLWVVILYLRRKQDRRLEGAVRVLLGDAVAQVQKVTGREVKMPTMPTISKIPQMSKKAG